MVSAEQIFQQFLRERTYLKNVTRKTLSWYESAWKDARRDWRGRPAFDVHIDAADEAESRRTRAQRAPADVRPHESRAQLPAPDSLSVRSPCSRMADSAAPPSDSTATDTVPGCRRMTRSVPPCRSLAQESMRLSGSGWRCSVTQRKGVAGTSENPRRKQWSFDLTMRCRSFNARQLSCTRCCWIFPDAGRRGMRGSVRGAHSTWLAT